MRGEYPEFFYGFPVITFFLGGFAAIGLLGLLGIDDYVTNPENPVLRAALLGGAAVIIYFSISPLKKYEKVLNEHFNSISWMCLGSFLYGLLFYGLASLYCLLPLPNWLLIGVAICIFVVLGVVMIVRAGR